MSIRSVVAASCLTLGAMGVPASAHAQEIAALEVSKAAPTPGEEVTIRVRLRPINNNYACGVRLILGDGAAREIRGTDSPDGVLEIKHTYAAAGTYSIMAEGKGMVRGLKSVMGCSGTRTLLVAVAAPQAACTPPADEYRAIECPSGMQGKVLQRRSFACPGPSVGPWVTESTDCKAAAMAPPPPAPPPMYSAPPAPAPRSQPQPQPQQRRVIGE